MFKKIKKYLSLIIPSFLLGFNTLAQEIDKYGIPININNGLDGSLYGVAAEDPRFIRRRIIIFSLIFLAFLTIIIGVITFIVKFIKRRKNKKTEISGKI